MKNITSIIRIAILVSIFCATVTSASAEGLGGIGISGPITGSVKVYGKGGIVKDADGTIRLCPEKDTAVCASGDISINTTSSSNSPANCPITIYVHETQETISIELGNLNTLSTNGQVELKSILK